MSVRMILLPVFVHVAFVFFLLFVGMRASTSASREGGWRDEITLAVLYYLLTICTWHTQFADILFLVLAWIFVVLRILAGAGVGPAAQPSTRNTLSTASVIVLAVMWVIYAVRLLLVL
jgi:hypothetical protein